MSRVLAMVRKDLLRRIRAPLGIGIVLAFPVVFSGLLALAFGGGTPTLPEVQLLVEDRDDSFLSGMLLQAFASEQLDELFELRQIDSGGAALMDQGEASALLVIPAGFGESLLRGTPVTLELVRNPSQFILPEIAEQTLAVFADLLDAASRLLREPLNELTPMLDDEAGEGPSATEVAAIAVSVREAIGSAEQFVFPPVITLESVTLDADEDEEDDASGNAGFSIFVLILPGVSVWALFMLGDIAMRDILTEMEDGTLRRQLAGPVTARDIVVSKALYTASLATISLLLLAAIGWGLANRSIDLAGFLLLSVAVVAAVTGFSSAVYGVAKTERQGATFSSIVLLVFGFVGGAFLQVGAMPDAVRGFAPLSPFYWAVTGYRTLIQDGGGVADVLVNVGVLALLGLLLSLFGTALLNRKIRMGQGV